MTHYSDNPEPDTYREQKELLDRWCLTHETFSAPGVIRPAGPPRGTYDR